MAVALKDRKRVSSALKEWTDEVSSYEREFKKWEGRSEKIVKRYRDEFRNNGSGDVQAKFNILWSNVQTLVAAVYAKVPKPDVSRRFRDNDQVGRVASLILERAEDYHLQHYSDFRSALRGCVQDRFLCGRGTVWMRYEPHFKAAELGQPTDGLQVTEDVDEANEELDYECVAVDYVHPKDFGHSVARTWEEVDRVWRKVYMTRDALVDRFGEEIAKIIPMDATPKEFLDKTQDNGGDQLTQRACIYEGWQKSTRKAVWFNKSVKDLLDERDDPLGLQAFFPCPKPIYATVTSDTLIPVPDFVLYQDQANSLDTIADRKQGLINALKVMGVYDASEPTLARLFSEGDNNGLIPVKNWQAFAEKQGLKGAIDIVDIQPIARALVDLYEAERRAKEDVYEITGISDIVRGQTQASETATAQQIKGQYASLRLKTYQEEVARFATEILQIMAQIMCGKFAPQTLLQISAADQLNETDKQLILPAIELLVGQERIQDPTADPGPNPLRSFRIEVASDTLVYMDEQAEKESRVEFLTATGAYIEKMGAVLMQTPPEAKGTVVGLLMDMLKFGVTGFRVGKNIEGTFDEAAEKLKQIANQPPPQPQEPPEVQIEKMRMQAEQERSAAQMAADREKAAADLQLQRDKMDGEQQLERERMERDFAFEDVKHQREMGHRERESAAKMELVGKPKAEIKIDAAEQIGAVSDQLTRLQGEQAQAISMSVDAMKDAIAMLADAAKQMAAAAVQMGGPREVMRDGSGRIYGHRPMARQ